MGGLDFPADLHAGLRHADQGPVPEGGLIRATYIGGPTALIEVGGIRLLTDPTFDSPGSESPPGPPYTLRKLQGPAVAAEEVGRLDAVLLSHDHHFDNLDRSGRAFLATVPRILTTRAGAERLGGSASGLDPWESVELTGREGPALRITATPARHGPAHADRGPVIGFALASADRPERAVYLSGDTVWYEGVAEVARHFRVEKAFLFMGAARVPAVGPWALTFTAAEGVEAARAFGDAPILPLHYEGWSHFSESRREITRAFAAAGIEERLVWLPGGVATPLPI